MIPTYIFTEKIMVILGIILSFIIFSVIVLIHEYGHYKSARIFGVHIEEFGLGIPPRAKKLWKNSSGTLFSLNWIPLGGFVKIAGESEIFFEYFDEKGNQLSEKNLSEKIKNTESIYDKKGKNISLAEKKYLFEQIKSFKKGQNFYEKNILEKTLILAAGVIMNFLLAAFIFSLLFFIGVKPIGVNSFIPVETSSKIIPTLQEAKEIGIIEKNPGVVLFPTENSVAKNAGIQEGEVLLSVNGEKVSDVSALQKIISDNPEKTLIFEMKDSQIEITPNSEGKIGSYIGENLSYDEDFMYNFGTTDAIKYGVLETYAQIRLTFAGLGYLLSNIISPETPQDRENAINSVAGPIGIVDVITKSLSFGIGFLLILSAIISVNLGVFNILPIPALDGGRILLLWIRSGIEKLFGKKSLGVKIENIIHVYTFILLIALSILIAYNDIIRLIFS